MTIDCTYCGGNPKGCEKCSWGKMEITRCPALMITPDIAELLEDADLFYQGLPPVAGGTLDQSARFMAAIRFVRATQNEVMAEMSRKQ